MSKVIIKTTGANGAATGDNTVSLTGMLNAIAVKFDATAPASTRVRIYLVFAGINVEIMDRTNSAGNFVHFPSISLMAKDGTVESVAVPYGNLTILVQVSLSNALDEAVMLEIS